MNGSSFPRWKRILLFFTLTLFVTRRVHAEPRVVVLQTPNDDIVVESVHRMQAELKAAGFDVALLASDVNRDPKSALEDAVKNGDTMAAVELFLTADGRGVEAWVLDVPSGKILTRIEVSVSLPNAPNVLAVRTAELLKASLLEFKISPPLVVAPPSNPPPATTPPAPATRGPLFLSWTVGVGLGAALHPGGLDLGLLPTVQISHAFVSPIAIRLRAAASVVASHFEAAGGSANLRQQLGVIDFVVPILPRARFVPTLSAGAGAYHLGVDGSAASPYVGESPQLWAALLDFGAGVAARLHPNVALLIDAHVFATFPGGDVQIHGSRIGQVGRPSLFFASTFLLSW